MPNRMPGVAMTDPWYVACAMSLLPAFCARLLADEEETAGGGTANYMRKEIR